ncbi:GGDEF domain-containing protein [Alteromonas halophila]|uniref:diguanylate cyclase n=1 Tax=Alteromonas halophila TaxID=516698 RepID=A0A918MVB8_9ALTE|nr:GGDEF domain-containing protein [Alteromonas halophila]GGW77958.1 hypothetical protein GCM10007391_08140 [Alteromonas halophila]
MRDKPYVGTPKRELTRLRYALLIGAALVCLFVWADLILLPHQMHSFYLVNRLLVQLPVVLVTLLLSFHPRFHAFKHWIFTALLIALTYSNYWLIHTSWSMHGYSFPYEGTILYAFYCIFALGIPYRYALVAALINMVGFLALMVFAPAYGDRVLISAAFVVGSLFIGVYAKYRLDSMMHLLREVNAKLIVLSSRDELTGLLNRRALMEESEQLMSLCQREKLKIAVLMADMDDFKKYNDEFGHQEGDNALTLQATILNDVFQRKTDIVGRYGGEEFMVVVSGLSEKEMAARCDDLLAIWKSKNLTHAKGASSSYVQCSIGVTVCDSANDHTLSELIKYADENLYHAKDAGKGQYVISCINSDKMQEN